MVESIDSKKYLDFCDASIKLVQDIFNDIITSYVEIITMLNWINGGLKIEIRGN